MSEGIVKRETGTLWDGPPLGAYVWLEADGLSRVRVTGSTLEGTVTRTFDLGAGRAVALACPFRNLRVEVIQFVAEVGSSEAPALRATFANVPPLNQAPLQLYKAYLSGANYAVPAGAYRWVPLVSDATFAWLNSLESLGDNVAVTAGTEYAVCGDAFTPSVNMHALWLIAPF